MTTFCETIKHYLNDSFKSEFYSVVELDNNTVWRAVQLDLGGCLIMINDEIVHMQLNFTPIKVSLSVYAYLTFRIVAPNLREIRPASSS